MGRSKKRRRDDRELVVHQEAAVVATPDHRFMRFALAFLIIFVLLWLFAPQDE